MSEIKSNNYDFSGRVGAWDIPGLQATNFQSSHPVLNTAFRVLNDGVAAGAQVLNVANNIAGNLVCDLPAAVEDQIVKHGGPSFDEMTVAAQMVSPGMPLDDMLAYAGARLSAWSRGVRQVSKVEGNIPKLENRFMVLTGKQGKHIVGHNNYNPPNSIFNHPNPQKLVDNFAGKGKAMVPGKTFPEAGYKERIDFGEVIGEYVDIKTGRSVPTTVGSIDYSTTGVHIVPRKPNAE